MSEQKQEITQLRQRLAQSTIIVDATRRFTSTLDSDEIRLVLFEAVFQIVGAQQVALHLINEKGLQSTICYPMEGMRIETAVLPPEATVFRICEEVEQVIWNRDDQTDPPISVEAIKFDSYLALPLKGADKVVGVIEAFNLLEPQNAVQQAALLVEIAGPAGLAIYNGTLYQESQHEIAERKWIEKEIRQKERELAKRAAQLETVSRVSTYTSTILEPDKLLQEVVNLTKDQFELYHVHIYLVNEAGDQLDLVVGAGDVGRQMVAQGRSIPLQQKQSLVAQVARSGNGLIENDVLNNPAFLPHPLLPDTRSETAVPVILRGRVVGVLDVQSDRVDMFTEQDVQIQTMLAAHIAVALENARSYEQAVTSLAETEALLDITKETSHVLELASITNNVLDKVLTATNFDAGLITIVNPNTQKLEVKSHRLPEQFWNMLQENGLDGTLCDLVYRRRESVVVVDMAADAPVDVTGLLGLGYKSYQGVPLESQGEVLGTLCLFSRQSLTSEKANSVFLQAAGRQVGIAIRNVALLEQEQRALSEAQQSRQLTQEYLNMQRLLHEINIELFRIDDLNELYRSAVELAHTRLGFERVGMYLLNESRDLLMGTYGIDAEGNICDERGPEYVIDGRETIDTFVLNRTRLVVREDIDLWHGGEVAGRGWHISAAMWTEDSPIGVIFADNLITGQPLKPYHSELLFAYAGIVSNLIQRNRFETIITERAAEMQAVAEVGTAAATILDTDELLQEVVDLTKNSFDLYHAHIYLLNKETEMLVLTSGAGEVGRQMVAEGRQIPLQQEQSLVARAARSRQGVIINDVQAEPGFLPHLLLPDTQAEMAVPLITGERVLGVLDVQSDRLNHFTKEDISTFTTLAAQTAVALQNARFFTQSEERAEELALINRIVTQMNTIQDVKASLQFLVEELGAATQAGSAVVNLINTDGSAQEVVAAYLQEGMPDPVGTVMPIEGDPMMVQLLEARQTLAVDDVANAPYPPEIRDVILQSGFRSLYIIPMFVGRDLIGSATIGVLQGGEPLTPEQIRLAETLVFQATSVVQNIRLYAQAEQRAEELAFVNRIVTEINSLDTRTGLQFMAEELGEILQIPSMVIGLIDGTGTMLEMVAAHHPAGVPSPVGAVFPVAGDPIMSQALQTRQTVVIEDVANSSLPPQAKKIVLKTGTRSMYVIPMIVGRDLIGTVSLNVMEGGSLLTPDQLNLAETTVYQAATAVQNARLFAKSEERAEELALINKVVAEVSASLDIEHSLQIVADELAKVVDLEGIGIALLNEDKASLTVVAERYDSEQTASILGYTYSIADNPVAQKAFSTRSTVLVEDAQNHPLTEPIHAGLRMRGVNTMYVIPMFAGSEIVGTVGFDSKKKDRLMSPQQLRLAETIVYQAATAVQNARLFTQSEERETLLRTIIDATPDWIFVKDRDHRYQMVNKGYADAFQMPPQDFIGKNDLDIGFPEDIVRGNPEKGIRGFWADDLEIMESGQAKVIDIEPAVVDSEQRYLHTIKAPLKDADGQVTAVIGFVHDISDRILIEETLRQNEADLSQALKVAKLAYWEYDVEKDLFTFNDQFFALFHTTAEEHGGYQLPSAYYAQHFVYPDDLPMVGAEIERALNSTDRHYRNSLEHRILYADGGVGYMSVNINLDRDEHGKILHHYGANQDITERKLFEEALHKEQERVQVILESINVPFAVTKMSDGKVIYCNAALGDLVGVPHEKLIGQGMPDFYANPSDREAYISQLREQGFVNNFDLHMKRGDGQQYWALLSGRLIEFQGEPAIITFALDVTERRKAQETIARRATELETVANVGTVAATILDPEELLQQVVDLTKERFDFYHAQIYLLNPQQDTLILAFGAGDVGHELVAQKHQISLNAPQSLVAQTARSGQAVVVNDVRENPNWLPNELLPETQSEMAVPMMVGNRVIGVLDVQANQRNRFTDQDVQIQTTLAAQVSIALENARSFEKAQTAVSEMNALTRRLTREGWQEYLTKKSADQVGFEYNAVELRPVSPIRKSDTNGTTTPNYSANVDDPRQFGRPIHVLGETIGQLSIVPDERESDSDSELAEIMNAVTERLSNHLENLRLTEQTQIALSQTEQQAERLSMLNEMGAELSRADMLDEILEIGVNHTAKILVADRVTLGMLTPEREHIEFVANWGEDESVQSGVIVPIGMNETMKTAVLENRVILEQQTALQTFDDMHSLMTAPLAGDNRIIGVINVGNLKPNYFTNQDQYLILQISSLLGAAVERQRLAELTKAALDETQKRSEELALLNRVMSAVTGSLDLNENMQIVARELAQAISVAHVGIALMTEDQNYLEVVTEYPLPDAGSTEDPVGQLLPIKGYPLTEQAIDSRKFMVAYDAQNNPLTAPIHDLLRQRGIATLAVLPMTIGDEIYGTVGFDILDPHRIVTDEQMRLAETIVYHTATVVQNARLFAQTEQRLADLLVIQRTVSDLTEAQSTKDALEALTPKLMSAVDADSVTIYEIKDEKMVRLIQYPELSPDFMAATQIMPLERFEIAQEATRSRGPLILSVDSPELLPDHLNYLQNAEIVSTALVPLVSQDGVVGLMFANMHQEGKNFSQHDTGLLQTLANQASIALDRIRLLEETRQRARREQLLREIAAKVRSTTQVDSVMRTAVQEVGRALGRKTFLYLNQTANQEHSPEKEL